jgi:succinate dehydrogenase/fumarate reductase-like Fe-S protein
MKIETKFEIGDIVLYEQKSFNGIEELINIGVIKDVIVDVEKTIKYIMDIFPYEKKTSKFNNKWLNKILESSIIRKVGEL